MDRRVPAMWMRGGTSKALYFLREDLPDDVQRRNRMLLKIMGSPDARQIDGVGGADPLTSKIANFTPLRKLIRKIFFKILQIFEENEQN